MLVISESSYGGKATSAQSDCRGKSRSPALGMAVQRGGLLLSWGCCGHWLLQCSPGPSGDATTGTRSPKKVCPCSQAPMGAGPCGISHSMPPITGLECPSCIQEASSLGSDHPGLDQTGTSHNNMPIPRESLGSRFLSVYSFLQQRSPWTESVLGLCWALGISGEKPLPSRSSQASAGDSRYR